MNVSALVPVACPRIERRVLAINLMAVSGATCCHVVWSESSRNKVRKINNIVALTDALFYGSWNYFHELQHMLYGPQHMFYRQ